MFEKVGDPNFIRGEHEVLEFWRSEGIFDQLRRKNAGGPKWSFLDGPITANNPMGVHHAWGRTLKDAYQRYFAMTGHELRYQNGFDCQGLWVEVEVEKELNFATKSSIVSHGIDRFVNACKRRVLTFAARQTEQSERLGYWMDWDDPTSLRHLAAAIDDDAVVAHKTSRGEKVIGRASEIVGGLGRPAWGGSYFTFSTENNETIWAFLKKCHARGKIYRGHDVMPWSGRGGSAYSQMEVAEGRRLTTHKSAFVRFPLVGRDQEYLLVWTTTPWTLTSNVAAAVNSELDYVRLKTKRDGAIYYFAKENLDFARLSKEFKEGFGRPEWSWPKGVARLKTIGQIFKEQGGHEIVGTVKGADLVGLAYRGPFDDLPAQQSPGGFPAQESKQDLTGVLCHRVVDGGRDAEGQPVVVAGEGTGIVHIAPGCGDVDHQLGQRLNLVDIAPLGEDGRFLEGFGPFTGREAIDRQTAELVFDQLRHKQLLVSVEDYPHIYPHCWRTGDELVFRMVDEWFIKMDWREEIMNVARQIRWLPDAIDGLERELEWLANMRDWMISKKRFWGLALPIWFDEQTHEFEVIGSLAELQERAVSGWDEFEGHTPHRPWIDRVKIRNPRTGNLMSRIPDVGNPWLDAGIVPFSTLQYNTQREAWRQWYPADLVTECFPGQFRNWFYALLSMATMVDNSPPFRTLLGHRLATNQEGKPMHKADGTAIWFEEAAEQLGVDTLRWMYLAQNPATDLRFGMRFPDRPVVLQTPAGPITHTPEGAATCEVSSKPADEIRRQVLIPLWNTYAFFVNYAQLDRFDPAAASVPISERPEIDRWILSNLDALVETANHEFQQYDAAAFLRAATAFIDDLSNWYVRRNRRRFWRSQTAGDRDKLAAYQTLYSVLVTVSKLLAPVIPFMAERMHGNLVRDPRQPRSVHLCDYPQPDPALRDAALSERMAVAQLVVNLGHHLREQAGRRVRQPLAELRFSCSAPAQRDAIERLAEVIQDELNVKRVRFAEHLDELVTYTYKPNLKTLGPKYGSALGKIGKALQAGGPRFAPLRRGETMTLTLDGVDYQLAPEDVLVGTQQAADWASGDASGVQIALATKLTPELIREGMARDFVRQVQQQRKDMGLEITDRILVFHEPGDAELTRALAEWRAYIQNETLAMSLQPATPVPPHARGVEVGEQQLAIWIEKTAA